MLLSEVLLFDSSALSRRWVALFSRSAVPGCTMENEEEADSEAAAFVEDSFSSDSEGVTEISDRRHRRCKRLIGESSPPLILAFTSGRAQVESSSPSPAPIPGLEEEDSDQPVEDWMILGGEEQEGDSSIQLNLAYWSSSEDDSGDEGECCVVAACHQFWIFLLQMQRHSFTVVKFALWVSEFVF